MLNAMTTALGMVPCKPKLVYFDARGVAEPIRWCFAYGGATYEDVRIQPNEWPALKSTTPFGQVPYLEHDGKQLGQSKAICRYAAKKNGLAGKDDWEAAQADALVDYNADLLHKMEFMFLEKDEKKKLGLKDAFLAGVAPDYLKGFERHLRANNNGEGFFVGSGPTWADFVLVATLDRLVAMDNTILDDYQALKELVGRVHELKGIKEWLLKRPVTEN